MKLVTSTGRHQASSKRDRGMLPEMAGSAVATLLACVSLAILPACTHDVVVGRYTAATCESPGAKAVPCHNVIPAADVSVVTIPAPPVPLATGSASAPAASTAAENPTPGPGAERSRRNVAAPPRGAPTSPVTTVDDRSVFHRIMIVTVAKDALKFNPADRIEATNVLIEPQDGATFTSWDTAATLNTTINAGTIQLTQTGSAGQNVSAGLPATGPLTGSLGLNASQGQTRVESFNATTQIDNLTVSVIGGTMRIRRQGGIGIDLTGNTLVKVDLTLPADWVAFKPIFSISGDYQDKAGHWVPPQSLKLTSDTVRVATKPQDIKANVTLTYTIRHIVSGDETLEERDDTVQELTLVNPAVIFTLVPGSQVSPPSYALYANDSRDAPPIYVARPTSSRNAPLCFDSYQAAQDFLAYIQHGNRARPQMLGNATLGYSDLSA